MATYSELFVLLDNSDLQDKTAVAVIIAAKSIGTEAEATPNHANRVLWARGAFENPRAVAVVMLRAVLAAHAGLTVAQITSATDAQLQTAVDAAVDTFARG